MNKRLTPKDRALIKSAVNRAFARSELYHKVKLAAQVEHTDPRRPKVKRWVTCAACGKPEAWSYVQVDHIFPKVPIDRTLEDMTWDELVDNTWCSIANLQVLDKACHDAKSKKEAEQRKVFRNARKAKELPATGRGRRTGNSVRSVRKAAKRTVVSKRR